MPANAELESLALIALVALLCGLAMSRLRQPAVIGYMAAGVVLGPSVLGLVRNEQNVALLAELGVLLLLFVIGMELSLRSFRRIWKIALATTAMQILGAFGAMHLIGRVMDWPLPATLLFGFVVALSSTAVAIKMLEEVGELRTRTGQIAVGVLIAQDLAVVPMMLALDVVVSDRLDLITIGRIVLSIGLLAALILFLSRRKRINFPVPEVIVNHPDLRPLLALAVCFGAATLSGVTGLSPAYGAFLAGLAIGNSNLRQGLVESTQPIQSILMMVFFLSVGLLIDLRLVWENILLVLSMLMVVTVMKTVLNIGILRVLRLPWTQAIITGVVLAQVGEFSFLLAGIGVRLDILDNKDFRLVITVTALSLAISPIWLATARRVHGLAAYRSAPVRQVLRLVYGREALWIASRANQTGRGIKWLFERLRNRSKNLRNQSKKRSRHLEPTLEPVREPAREPTTAPDAAPVATETPEQAPDPATDEVDARFRA